MTQCKLYARGGGGSQERVVADGADVVFTSLPSPSPSLPWSGPSNTATGSGGVL